jgi:hypothetical protein
MIQTVGIPRTIRRHEPQVYSDGFHLPVEDCTPSTWLAQEREMEHKVRASTEAPLRAKDKQAAVRW